MMGKNRWVRFFHENVFEISIVAAVILFFALCVTLVAAPRKVKVIDVGDGVKCYRYTGTNEIECVKVDDGCEDQSMHR